MVWSLTKYVTTVPSLVAIATLLEEIWFLSVTWPCKTTWTECCVILLCHHPTKFHGLWHFWHCGSGDVMDLACHMRLRDHVIRGSCEFMDSNLVSYGPARFGGHRHCGSGDMFLVAEEETLGCSCFNPPLLFNFSRTWVESAPHIILLTPILVTRSQSSKWTNTGKYLLPVCPKTSQEGEKEKERQLQSVMR